MEIIFLLLPLALALVAFVVWAFWWAIRSGQFDDMEGPAHRILMDDENKGSLRNEDSDGTPRSWPARPPNGPRDQR